MNDLLLHLSWSGIIFYRGTLDPKDTSISPTVNPFSVSTATQAIDTPIESGDFFSNNNTTKHLVILQFRQYLLYVYIDCCPIRGVVEVSVAQHNDTEQHNNSQHNITIANRIRNVFLNG